MNEGERIVVDRLAIQKVKQQFQESLTCQLLKITGFNTIDQTENPWDRDLCTNIVYVVKQAMKDCEMGIDEEAFQKRLDEQKTKAPQMTSPH